MTPLFPEKGQPIIIKQGKVNDCYLLSSLDCILNGGTDGRELVQSKFKQAQSGVYLRLKRTAQSSNLDPKKMAGKYEYSYNQQADEDIIFINNKKLKEIDKDTNGAQSNSLAVKILERISAYYYAGQWDGVSLLAHNIQERHRETSTIFVSKLLGLQAADSRSFDDIIKLKAINPNEHIYISMNFGAKDQFGNYHGRHALRIEQIIPMVNGDFEFILVNPWDNQKREPYYFADLKERNCRFSVFDTDQQKKELTPILLQCPVQQGQYVFKNPELFPLLSQMNQEGLIIGETSLSPEQVMQACISLHQQIPNLVSEYNKLSLEKQKKILLCISQPRGSVDSFNALLSPNPARVAQPILIEKEKLRGPGLHQGPAVPDQGKQAQPLYPPQGGYIQQAYTPLSFKNWIAGLDDRKAIIISQALYNEGRQFNLFSMMQRMQPLSFEEKRQLQFILSTHKVEYLGGQNSKSFLVTDSVTGERKVLNLEKRWGTPDVHIKKLQKNPNLQNYLVKVATSKAVEISGDPDGMGIRYLQVTDFCQGKDLTTLANMSCSIEERLAAASSIYIQMTDVLVHMENSGTFHPDMKNSNWLLDENGHLKIADTKALCPTNNAPVSLQILVEQGYEVVNTPYISPPEIQNCGNHRYVLFSASKAEVFMIGKNLYEFLASTPPAYTLGHMANFMQNQHDGNKYDFSAPIFQTLEGNRYVSLICACIKENPDDRLDIHQVQQAMKAIESLRKNPHILLECREIYGNLHYIGIQNPELRTQIYRQLVKWQKRIQNPMSDAQDIALINQEMQEYSQVKIQQNPHEPMEVDEPDEPMEVDEPMDIDELLELMDVDEPESKAAQSEIVKPKERSNKLKKQIQQGRAEANARINKTLLDMKDIKKFTR